VPGFEPGTSCSQSRRATKLRHTPHPSTHRKTAPGSRLFYAALLCMVNASYRPYGRGNTRL
jgi:hypothetical protein